MAIVRAFMHYACVCVSISQLFHAKRITGKVDLIENGEGSLQTFFAHS